jgi:hypothetical protein
MITNYAELQSNIADFIHRSDLTAVIPTFIQLAEAKIANNIKGRKLIKTATLTLTSGSPTLALPTDYENMKSIVVLSTPHSICEVITYRLLSSYNASGETGIPQFYNIIGDSIHFSKIPDSNYSVKITYETKLIPLSVTNTTNFVLTSFPYLYLYGSLIEASIFSNDVDQVQFYQTKYDAAVLDVNKRFEEEQKSNNLMRSSTITNFNDLQSNIADFMHTTDMYDIIPTFIQLAESKIANNIKGRKLSTSVTLTLTAGIGYLVLPTDYVSIQSVVVLTNPASVCELISDNQLSRYNADGSTGIPRFYNIIGDNMYFSKIPDANYSVKITYETRLIPLSDLTTTNFILKDYPYLYLYASLIEGHIYANMPEQVQFYQQKYNEAIDDVNRKFGEESWSGSPLRSFSDYVV